MEQLNWLYLDCVGTANMKIIAPPKMIGRHLLAKMTHKSRVNLKNSAGQCNLQRIESLIFKARLTSFGVDEFEEVFF